MADAKLAASSRQDQGKGVARKLRAAGRVPAVMYGHGEKTRSLTVDAHELTMLFNRVHWENTIIQLDIEGEEVSALVREVQTHAFKTEYLHVDFYQIHADETLDVEVPIRLHGTPAGAKMGGILAHGMNDLLVRCLPSKIPNHIDVDIAALNIGDAIHVSDLALPEGVESLIEGDRMVASITHPTTSVADAPVVAPAGGEPEVIKRGKDEA